LLRQIREDNLRDIFSERAIPIRLPQGRGDHEVEIPAHDLPEGGFVMGCDKSMQKVVVRSRHGNGEALVRTRRRRTIRHGSKDRAKNYKIGDPKKLPGFAQRRGLDPARRWCRRMAT
jgi:TPP-dependent pyruvate/acetoin dehydrogenase alpha subunit